MNKYALLQVKRLKQYAVFAQKLLGSLITYRIKYTLLINSKLYRILFEGKPLNYR